MSETNTLTTKILNFLFTQKVFAWRNNTVGIPMTGGRLRPAGKVGTSDILAILPPDGRFLGIEIKTGRDELSLEQQGFLENIAKMGGLTMVVGNYDDFLSKYTKLNRHLKDYGK